MIKLEIKLNNGVVLNAVAVNGRSRYFQNADRDTLEFQFTKANTEQTLEELDILFSDPANTSKIVISDESGSYVYDNYTLKVSVSLIPVTIEKETDVAPATIEDRYSIVLAQRTYSELKIDLIEEQLALTQQAVDILLGGEDNE